MLKRLIKIDILPSESFFMWGPRQVGKSTLLRSLFPASHIIDLLQADSFIRYSNRPQLLREELLAMAEKPNRIVIDEIQKIPLLLDEIHFLIERHQYAFALCGSSARKLKRGHANLLGGRALRFELTGLSAAECGPEWNLEQMLNTGYLPRHYLNPDRSDAYLRSYVNDYLKEEIAAEGLVRNLPVFSEFLRMAALSDTEILNYSTIARDVGVSSPTIKEYFSILVDTLLGTELPAFIKRPKRRTKQAPKFYCDDVGSVNQLTNRTNLEPKQMAFGKAFE
ncbi:MAG: AAA family ATPase, partial [Proteobacteria bacterium]|nr:AAA family ATPase [Pseudomonadota bacterium]